MQRNVIDGSAVTADVVSDALGYTPLQFALRATYALMVADGNPLSTIFYKVTNDENKGRANTYYIWFNDGKRFEVPLNPDN
jgi:hypothetical protein